MNSKFFNNLLFGLILLTLLALYAHANWMTRSLRIDLIPNATVTVVDDHSFGGTSVATLVKSNKGYTLQCTITDKYQWRFCEIDFRLTEDNSGLDLSDFDSIKLDIESKGPEKTIL